MRFMLHYRGQWFRRELRYSRRNKDDSINMTNWFRRASYWLVPVGIALVVFSTVVAQVTLPSMVHDAYQYSLAAHRLVNDGYFAFAPVKVDGAASLANAKVTPGYVLFLAIFYSLLGRQVDAVTALEHVQPFVTATQFLLALAAVAVLACAGRELGGRRMGLTVGLLGAFYFPFAWTTTVSLSESLALPLLAIQLWWSLRLTAKGVARSPVELASFGALSAYIVLVRPSTALWVVVPLIYAVVSRVQSPGRLATLAAAAFLGFVLVMTPWWVRNYTLLDTFVALRSDVVQTASGPQNIGSEAPPVLDRNQKNRVLFAVATAPWCAPDDVLWENAFHYDVERVDLKVFPIQLHERLVPLITIMHWYQLALAALALSALLLIRRSPRILIVASMPIYHLLVHYETQLNPRYAFLGTPALIVLAGVGLYAGQHYATKAFSTLASARAAAHKRRK